MRKAVHKARRAHHHLVSLPTVIIIISILLFGWLSLYTLRQNNLKMSELRTAVADADAVGEKELIEESLQALQRYVSRHMNTTTRVDLGSSYQRDAIARQEAAARRLGNVNLYNRAERECRQSNVRGSALAECINDRLSGAAGSLVELPDPRLYRYSFAAPPFSLDLAGLTLIIFGLFVYAGLHQLAVYLVKRLAERRAADQ